MSVERDRQYRIPGLVVIALAIASVIIAREEGAACRSKLLANAERF
jgi:hypothetical protein